MNLCPSNLQSHEEHRLTVGILDDRFESSVELSPHFVQIDPLIDIIAPYVKKVCSSTTPLINSSLSHGCLPVSSQIFRQEIVLPVLSAQTVLILDLQSSLTR